MLLGDVRGAGHLEELAQAADALGRLGVGAEIALQPIQNFRVRPLHLGQVDNAAGRVGADAGFLHHLRSYSLPADLGQLVESDQ